MMIRLVAPGQVASPSPAHLQQPAPPALAPVTHTCAYNPTLVNCWSICGALVAYYHCHLIDGNTLPAEPLTAVLVARITWSLEYPTLPLLVITGLEAAK